MSYFYVLGDTNPTKPLNEKELLCSTIDQWKVICLGLSEITGWASLYFLSLQ